MENSSTTMIFPLSSSSHEVLNSQGAASSSSSSQHEFVNQGLAHWNQTRQQWVGNKTKQTQSNTREPRISWNATYESLLGTSKTFYKPIPLFEMVDFLVDLWEEEGLYDC